MGDDAVGAPQDAAILYLDVGPLATVEMRDSLGKLHDAETPEHVGEFALVSDNFKDAWQSCHGRGIPGGVAAHHDGACAGVTPGQLANQLTPLGVSG